MVETLQTITKQIDAIEKRLKESQVELPSCSNVQRRILYSDAELTRLQLADIPSLTPEDILALDGRLDGLTKQLDLRPLAQGNPIGKFFRLTSLILTVMISGAFLALPVIMLRSVDAVLKTSLSEFLKRMISHWLLLVSGVMVSIEGLADSPFTTPSTLLTFSHASNLDGFLITATCPVRYYALAKKELFLVPFFSWISLAFGGVPVDRNDRNRAISALQRSTAVATSGQGGGGGGGGKMCLAIAPEGTRSKSGQLSAFKKGAFHMWEQMQAPIVPFITYGAFDLYPVGSWINNTGRVHGRYLPPLLPQEGSSRDQMSRLLRKRMLLALKENPDDSSPLSPPELLCHYAAMNITWATSFLLTRFSGRLLTRTLGLSVGIAVAGVCVAVVLITVLLYVYYVYIVSMGAGGGGEKKKKAGAEQNKKKE